MDKSTRSLNAGVKSDADPTGRGTKGHKFDEIHNRMDLDLLTDPLHCDSGFQNDVHSSSAAAADGDDG